MRLLFDTNVLIRVEDPRQLTQDLQAMMTLIRQHGHQVFVHPSTFADISRDENLERRRVMESKLRGYPQLTVQTPDETFLAALPQNGSPNEAVDNELLYTLYRNNIDFLVTEDLGIFRKAARLGCDDRVLSISSALRYLKSLHERWQPDSRTLVHGLVSELDVNDQFFDSLRTDYDAVEFNRWFERISRQGRDCWYYEEADRLKALMILKEETDVIETEYPLPSIRRLKICTLKVDMPGSKIGEAFLKIAFDFCFRNRIREIYLTHYVKENDPLVVLLNEFDFSEFNHARNRDARGQLEKVFVKSFVPTPADLTNLTPLDFARKYYPALKDGENVQKFIVPIKPVYHNRLFPTYRREQTTLSDYEQNPYGNAIKKAYLCHSHITRISPGDMLFFYRSRDEQSVGCLGVVEKTLRSSNADELTRFVGKRTVYSVQEINQMVARPVLAILFRHHLDLPVRVPLEELCTGGILHSAPQSIGELTQVQYSRLKRRCNLDERIVFP